MPKESPTYQLLDHLLPRGLAHFVVTHRKLGWSWRRIAADVTEETGVAVSFESLRSWCPDEGNGDEAVA